MPVIRPSGRWDAKVPRETLVEQLTKELLGEAQAQGPVIFEVPIRDTDTFHVIVVWEEWAGVSPEDRSSIILEAYANRDEARVDDDPMSPRITLVIGATAEEAIELDLLPYSLTPDVHRKHAAYDEIKQAMLQEGAIRLPTGHVELRFPTLQMAKEARDQLSSQQFSQIEEVRWQIGETVGRFHD
jgi:hypothetical protein